MTWYVHRRQDGSIAIAMEELLPGYSLDPQAGELLAEAIDESDPEVRAIRFPGESSEDKQRALQGRRAADLLASPAHADQIAGLKLKLELLGG